ncbi:hypothetical protein GGR55DRAFT_682028 [Xylaria sp. FL0064]|nr:hypothetical protein GGR55DRAFT_682028 [Xylaria sp. FL0064]
MAADDTYTRYAIMIPALYCTRTRLVHWKDAPAMSSNARRSSISQRGSLDKSQPDSPPSPETTRHSCLAAGSTLGYPDVSSKPPAGNWRRESRCRITSNAVLISLAVPSPLAIGTCPGILGGRVACKSSGRLSRAVLSLYVAAALICLARSTDNELRYVLDLSAHDASKLRWLSESSKRRMLGPEKPISKAINFSLPIRPGRSGEIPAPEFAPICGTTPNGILPSL